MKAARHTLRAAALLLAMSGLATSAAAAPASSRLCRVVTLLRCAPDLCTAQALPGTTGVGELPPLDPFAEGRRTSVSYDAAGSTFRLCWDGRCGDGTVATQWTSGEAFGATGRVREEILAGFPEDGSYRLMFETKGDWIYFNLAVHPAAEQSDYWVLNGDCEQTP